MRPQGNRNKSICPQTDIVWIDVQVFAPSRTSERSHCILTDRSKTVGYVSRLSPLNIRSMGNAHGARLGQTFMCPDIYMVPQILLYVSYTFKRLFQTCVMACRHAMTHMFKGWTFWQSDGR